MTEKNIFTSVRLNKLRCICKYLLMSELHNTEVGELDSVCQLYLQHYSHNFIILLCTLFQLYLKDYEIINYSQDENNKYIAYIFIILYQVNCGSFYQSTGSILLLQ